MNTSPWSVMSLDFTGKMVGRLTGDIQESDAPYSQISRDNNEQRGKKLDMYEMYLNNFKNETLFSKRLCKELKRMNQGSQQDTIRKYTRNIMKHTAYIRDFVKQPSSGNQTFCFDLLICMYVFFNEHDCPRNHLWCFIMIFIYDLFIFVCHLSSKYVFLTQNTHDW